MHQEASSPSLEAWEECTILEPGQEMSDLARTVPKGLSQYCSNFPGT